MVNNMDILITGHSQGLGKALSTHYLRKGHVVTGLSRSLMDGGQAYKTLKQVTVDLANLQALPETLKDNIDNEKFYEVVFLNAGQLGDIKRIAELELSEIWTLMNLNVWANKIILDWLISQKATPKTIIVISSGASKKGSLGWGSYAISKAALNMLVQLYAHEMPQTRILALSPGLVRTQMQAQLQEPSKEQFPSLKRFQESWENETIPSAETVAEQLAKIVSSAKNYDSGSYIDLRETKSVEI